MNNPEKTLENQCNRIMKHMRSLIHDVTELANTPEDEAAYSIIYNIQRLYDAMEKAKEAGMDEEGNDVMDAYEATANAIRAAKEEGSRNAQSNKH